MCDANYSFEGSPVTTSTIIALFLGVYLVAVFAGALAFLRMRRENEELRDRIAAMERREWDVQRGPGDFGLSNSEPGP